MRGLASLGASDVAGVVEPELVRLMSRIHDANARLARLHEQGSHTASRLLGHMPESVGAGNQGPSSDGVVPMLHDAVNDLHARISECDADMQRLATL